MCMYVYIYIYIHIYIYILLYIMSNVDFDYAFVHTTMYYHHTCTWIRLSNLMLKHHKHTNPKYYEP